MVASAAAPAAAAADANDAEDYEATDPVDILKDLGKDFDEGLHSKKWSERRDALQKLKGLASTIRLAPGDYGDIMRQVCV